MKPNTKNNKVLKTNNLCWMAVILILCAAVSCRKYNYLGFTPGKGAPTITSVHTLTKTDTVNVNDTLVAYNSSGDTTLTIRATQTTSTAFDSVTTTGNLGNTYVIEGSNLGSATSVSFNGVSAYFNRALMTDNSIIVAIPSNTPYLAPQATDSLVVTTLHGTAYYKFTIIPPPPTPSTYSDYDFWNGSQMTLKGVGFASITAVGLTGSSANVSIVSQTDTIMTLQFPSATVNEANLVFTYNLLGQTNTAAASQELVDLDNAYTIVFNNSFQNSWADNSWTHPSGIISGPSHEVPGGTASAVGTYPAGDWQIEGWDGYSAANGGIEYSPNYKYLTFWILGGVAKHTLTLVGDKTPGGYGQVQITAAPAAQLVVVPPGVWTYYKIPLGTGANQLNFWSTGTLSQQLGFFLQGQTGDVNETLYFDEVAFTP
jgi:hypothetical protein